jgi:hypothetical protein
VLHSAFDTKVRKHHAWLIGPQQNYTFMPVVTDTSGAIHPEAYKLNNAARSLLGFGWN